MSGVRRADSTDMRPTPSDPASSAPQDIQAASPAWRLPPAAAGVAALLLALAASVWLFLPEGAVDADVPTRVEKRIVGARRFGMPIRAEATPAEGQKSTFVERRTNQAESTTSGSLARARSYTNILPELASPEEGARELLAMLRHLPAQPPVFGALTSPYGYRPDPLDPGAATVTFHAGIDLFVPYGTEVMAPGPGTVVATGRGGTFGTYVRIRHAPVGLESMLAHLSGIHPAIRRGAAVRRGQVIGRSGSSGRSTGPHVHFGISTHPGMASVDPVAVYELYFAFADLVAEYPIAAVHATFDPYRIWVPASSRPAVR